MGVYIGGTFWDGRTPDEPHQATQPFIDANEMANLSSNGIQDPVAGGYSALVVKKVQSRPYTHLFKKVYGPDVFTKYTTQQIYTIITEAIGAYEASAEINPFNSKYDASKYGTPPQNLYTLSASEERGRILYGVGPNPSNNPNFGTGPMLPVPLVPPNLDLAARDRRQGDVHHVLLCQYRCPQEPQQPLLREYGSHHQSLRV